MPKNGKYSDDVLEKIGDVISEKILKDIEDDELKEYITKQIVDSFERGEDVQDDLAKILVDMIMDHFVDEIIKQDNKDE